MIVFVHGVPETAAIWRKVRERIPHASVALELPGFGCPLPDGFGAGKDDYATWLVGELGRIDGPIDLVGHDWGAGLVFRVATAFPQGLRSWAADVGNIAHPDYEWHDFAKTWQTPGDGEAFVAAQAAQTPEEGAAVFETMGVPAEDALEMAAAGDDTMGACILALYRSARPNPHADWGPWSPTGLPGLVLHPTDDPFGDRDQAKEVADALGAGFAPIEGAGHFWPYQAPDQAVEVLQAFWGSLE